MIQSGGNVGLGTLPRLTLDVNGGTRVIGLATGSRSISPDAINTNALFLNGSNAMGVSGTNVAFAPGALFTKTSFYSGGVQRMTIDGTTGNVGIGTTAPAAKLDVAGNLNLPTTTSATAGVITLGGAPFLHNFGTANTFVGASAGNTSASLTGANNTAVGASALNANTTGFGNSAFGSDALQHNTTGNANSAFSFQALLFNTGSSNAAFGTSALFANTTGNSNSAFGSGALGSLTSGGSNIAIGLNAGSNLTAAESNNIYIGNTGVANESNIIRIGVPGVQTATFIAGISGATINGASAMSVFVDSLGHLGTMLSSRRFKEEISDLGEESDLLMKLRPVAFYYKPQYDETHTRQYGLVAEEVAQVAPATRRLRQGRCAADGALPLRERHALERSPEAAGGNTRTERPSSHAGGFGGRAEVTHQAIPASSVFLITGLSSPRGSVPVHDRGGHESRAVYRQREPWPSRWKRNPDEQTCKACLGLK